MAFQLKANKIETENKTVRFPLPLVEEIEQKLTKYKDFTFSNFVIQACEYALKEFDDNEDDKNE